MQCYPLRLDDIDDVDISCPVGCECPSASCVVTGVFGPPEFSLVLWAEDWAVAVAANTSSCPLNSQLWEFKPLISSCVEKVQYKKGQSLNPVKMC